MKNTLPIPAPYRTVASFIRAEHLERVVAVAEAIAHVVARGWRELTAPPRPAWMIVAVREPRRGNEVTLRFAP